VFSPNQSTDIMESSCVKTIGSIFIDLHKKTTFVFFTYKQQYTPLKKGYVATLQKSLQHQKNKNNNYQTG